MNTLLLALTLAAFIGLLLGLLGGGGSILTVPMLVYVLDVPPKTAIVTSFVVVGLSSLGALIPYARRRVICWRSGFFFGVAGMAGAYGGGLLAEFFSETQLMTLFGSISLGTGVLMLGGKQKQTTDPESPGGRICPARIPYAKVLGYGSMVGVVTGLVGVGGGFLIVPALNLLVGLALPAAVGTSLFIIAMNAVAGFWGYQQHATFDSELTVIVALGALLGSGLGAVLSGFVKPALLRTGFAGLIILVAVYVLSHSLPTLLTEFNLKQMTMPWHWLEGVLNLIVIGMMFWAYHHQDHQPR